MTVVDNLQVGLLGLGTVGRGVYRIITDNEENIRRKIGAGIEIKKILVRDTDKNRDIEIDMDKITTNPQAIIDDPEIKIVVEVMGGLEPTL
ncbi:MAG: homoserine dehydrogenase, partial [Firmicutes bacterium]|nr:homoserine dehydrogenase [Bacillota bacterium]